MNFSIKPLLVLLAVFFLGACSSTGLDNILPDKQVEYKRESVTDKKLEVPPDLSSSRIENRIPGLEGGVTTYSEYTGVREAKSANGLRSLRQAVLPENPDIKVNREGRDRWLVIKAPADAVWDKVIDFWQENGILLDMQDPSIGVMETTWLENKANVSNGFITDFIQKIFEGAYDAGLRDRFRIRLERGEDPDTTELYLVHFGMEQDFVTGTTNEEDQIYWKIRPRDPGLEAIMLNKIMVYLGLSEAEAKAALAAAREVQGVKTRLVKGSDGVALLIGEPFSKAWRLTGLALDRVGFVVEDRDRSHGTYYVRYNDPMDDSSDGGWLSKLAFWRSNDKVDEATLYLVRVQSVDGGSQVRVLSEDGERLKTGTDERILTLIKEQLK
ncbi:outer membrane protein assembly factor BamC [Thiolapillus brandeum]|uniref:Lipoprotein-34 n=1 Tax=Thiolapillus brandeum TaxID=1076588 RepID=A0A7U6GK19_9GAMM|nr:outer membrane protein assembly factor BamC [Thiolapillus brandeum]BAO45019.1 lipoprotein-34 [Thiolapillus brandeum]